MHSSFLKKEVPIEKYNTFYHTSQYETDGLKRHLFLDNQRGFLSVSLMETSHTFS